MSDRDYLHYPQRLAERLTNTAEGCLSLGYGDELVDLLREAARELAGAVSSEDNDIDSKIVRFPGQTLLGIHPDVICDAAKKAKLKYMMIVGVDRSGILYFASSDGDVTMALWQLERAKRSLFDDIAPGDITPDDLPISLRSSE